MDKASPPALCQWCESRWDHLSPALHLQPGVPAIWFSSREPICQCRRHTFDAWVTKIPWQREWQPTPVIWPGESHGQGSLAGYSQGSQRARHNLATKINNKQSGRGASPEVTTLISGCLASRIVRNKCLSLKSPDP